MLDKLNLEEKIDLLLAIHVANPSTISKDVYQDESIACKMLGYKERTFREKCKKNELPINFRRNPTGRGYQYNIQDILKFKKNTSTEM